MTALMLLCGAGGGAGLLLVIWGCQARVRPSNRPRRAGRPPSDVVARLAKATAGGLVAGGLTRWPVGVLGGFLFGYFASDLFGGRPHRNAETEQTQAIASWTEMLRDTMAAASGLEQAIATTAPIAPVAIRPQIQALVARLRRERLATGLAELAEALANPVADLVVSALTLAANGEAQDLGELLGSLSAAARDGATMRLRIDASRARTRTSVRIITAVTVAMAGLLVLLNRTYLQPFDSATGQCVLLLVFACFAGALWWLVQMSRYVAPERFLVGSDDGDSPWS